MKSLKTINFSKVIIVILLCITTITTVKSQVTYNNDAVSFIKIGMSITQVFDVPAGTNRMLILHTGCDAAAAAVISVTYNGQNFTLGVKENYIDFFHEEIWYLPLGTGGAINSTVTINYNKSVQAYSGLTTYQYVDQTTPIGNIGTNVIVSTTPTTSTLSINADANDLIIDGLFVTGLWNTSQTHLFTEVLSHASYLAAVSGSNNMTWTSTSATGGAHVGMEVNHDGISFLPVELTDFKGENTERGNHLTWQTASEQNNEGFEIQRSVDGQNWENIGFVQGNGTTVEVSNYEFIDELNRVGFKNRHGLYYRLKQIDYDGKYEYSKTIQLATDNPQQATVRIFPNPATNILNIETTESAIVQIFNTNGQMLIEFSSQSLITNLPITDLPNGVYYIKAGRNTQKIIIQRNF